MQFDGYAIAAHIGCVEFRMCHVCSLFQSCYDLQIFAYFFYCVNVCVFLQVGCAGYACCVYFFQFLAVGGYFGDLITHLRVYCEVQGLALVYGMSALDCCCAYRVYRVIYVVLAFYCCLANQIFCLHCIGSCVCASPDGYGVVCLTCQLAHQFDGIVLQELLIAIKVNFAAVTIVICRILSRSLGFVVYKLTVFGLVSHGLTVCGFICCGGLVCLRLICYGFFGLILSNSLFCLGGLRNSLGFLFRNLSLILGLSLSFFLSAVC